MKSSDLHQFENWEKWEKNLIHKVPEKPGVYIFKLESGTFRRLLGESDVVYIGATKKGKNGVRQRLKNHLVARKDQVDTGWRLTRIEREIGPLQVAWKVFEDHFEAQYCEGELLDRYQKDHIELPPLNRQESMKKFRGVEKMVKSWPEEQQKEWMRRMGLAKGT